MSTLAVEGRPEAFDQYEPRRSEEMSHWIKCSEQLPEIGKEVLIRIPTCGHWNVEGGSYRGDGIWHGAFCSVLGKGKCYQVTQWAEAPEVKP